MKHGNGSVTNKMHLVRCEKHSEYVKHGKSCVTNDILMSSSVEENTSPENVENVLGQVREAF